LKIYFLKLFIFSTFILFALRGTSQDTLRATDTSASKAANLTFEKDDQIAYYPGGLEAWKKYLLKKLDGQFPIRNGAPSGKYRVMVKFKVTKTGELTDIVAENDPGYGLADEAVRIIQRSGNWIPAIQRNKPVNCILKQPISWVVE
jgi:hypothetical protein